MKQETHMWATKMRELTQLMGPMQQLQCTEYRKHTQRMKTKTQMMSLESIT